MTPEERAFRIAAKFTVLANEAEITLSGCIADAIREAVEEERAKREPECACRDNRFNPKCRVHNPEQIRARGAP